MTNLKVTPVDPRYVSQEIENPVYRVDFWTKDRASEEHRLENASSVDDVLEWAEANRRGRYVVIWVEYGYRGGTGLCRLRGWEPTDQGGPSYRDPLFNH
ncbi:hypothetical protein GCM10027562_11510 [Arthrobacter pigmenti]